MTAINKSTHSKPRPVFIAAMVREIASIVSQRGWRADEKLLARKIHLFEHEDAIIACAGMGTDRASLATGAAMALGPISELISVGWAGSCHPNFRVGDILRPTIVCDIRTGERLFSAQLQKDIDSGKEIEHQILVTVPKPAGVNEKKRISIDYYAGAVDMEASAVARIALAHDIPFSAIKAISDDADFELPDLSEFTTPDGQFREAAFGMHVALHPNLWKRVLKMAKSSKLAAQRLRSEIEARIQLDRDPI
jgi:adenosylhomocysteine nucleosidase